MKRSANERQRPRRIGPEDEDRQSQLDDEKGKPSPEEVLRRMERRVRESVVDDSGFAPRR